MDITYGHYILITMLALLLFLKEAVAYYINNASTVIVLKEAIAYFINNGSTVICS